MSKDRLVGFKPYSRKHRQVKVAFREAINCEALETILDSEKGGKHSSEQSRPLDIGTSSKGSTEADEPLV